MKIEKLLAIASMGATAIAACGGSDNTSAQNDAGQSSSSSGSGGSSGSGSSSGGSTSSSGGEADGGSGGGSMAIPCGSAPCAMPMACCRPTPAAGAKDASAAALMCIVGCDFTTQQQLCLNDNDCQAGPQFCVQGVCADMPAGGGSEGGIPADGGVDDAGTDAKARDGGKDAGRVADAGRG